MRTCARATHVFNLIVCSESIVIIAVGPKGPLHPVQVGQLFGWVWRPQTIRGALGGHAYFPAKSGPKIKNEK